MSSADRIEFVENETSVYRIIGLPHIAAISQMTLLRPLDIILIVIVTAAAAGSYFLMEKKAGSQAEIYVDNRKTASFNLDGAVQSKDITTKIGKVRVKYGDGSVQVTRSPCPQKICVRQGSISHTYENIICLPAQLQIVIVNETNSLKSTGGIDAFSH